LLLLLLRELVLLLLLLRRREVDGEPGIRRRIKPGKEWGSGVHAPAATRQRLAVYLNTLTEGIRLEYSAGAQHCYQSRLLCGARSSGLAA
jgi:hypothetical protein